MKIFLLIISFSYCSFLYAQVPEDALRYSFYPQNGTARNLAIGSAMGSLGGDLNATYVNPAGLGFYKTSEFVFTPGFFANQNKASYRESNTKNSNNNLGFGPTGVIFGFSGNRPNISSAISFAVTQSVNFNNSIQYKGLNNYSSLSEQFAEEFAKSGYTIDEVLSSGSPLPYTAAPALYSYLIDTVKVNGVYQIKAAPEYILEAGQALMQEMNKTTSGDVTELAFGFALNKNDKWFWGATLALPIINYSSNTYFKEYDTSGNSNNHFKSFDYTDEFTTKGVGVNAKFGVIFRPKEYLRFGLAIHTPTYMSLSDKRTTTINTQLENPVATFSGTSLTFTNYQPGQADYGQITPFKAILSASFVFRELENVKKQKGFITADIEYIQHNGSYFVSEGKNITEQGKAYYRSLGDVIKADYKGNFNFRAGGELKFNVIMARLGFAFYGNPYKDPAFKANRMLLSGGLGYRNKGFFVDLTYIHTSSNDVSFPYRLEDKANTYATLKQQNGNIVATVGFKF